MAALPAMVRTLALTLGHGEPWKSLVLIREAPSHLFLRGHSGSHVEMGRSRETRQEAAIMIQVRDAGGLDQGGSHGGVRGSWLPDMF